MENLKTFLESSTIHGLSYIATGKRNVRLFWILVVIAGFTVAGILIQTSFQSWNESPVKTTIETHPIAEITFPKVTVCPPKNTYTNLNYDLMMTENMTLDNDTRQELANYAVQMLYEHLYDNIMSNVKKSVDNDRYFNWYHGYTAIKVPTKDSNGHVSYDMRTAATFGSISTQYFGEQFDAAKVETDIWYTVGVSPPASVRNNPNVTLHIDIEKVSLEDLSSGQDKLYLPGRMRRMLKTSHRTFNFTPPTQDYWIRLDRKVLPSDMKKKVMDLMPGFKITWHYSGIEVEPKSIVDNKDFVRKGSMNILNSKILFNTIFRSGRSSSFFIVSNNILLRCKLMNLQTYNMVIPYGQLYTKLISCHLDIRSSGHLLIWSNGHPVIQSSGHHVVIISPYLEKYRVGI